MKTSSGSQSSASELDMSKFLGEACMTDDRSKKLTNTDMPKVSHRDAVRVLEQRHRAAEAPGHGTVEAS